MLKWAIVNRHGDVVAIAIGRGGVEHGSWGSISYRGRASEDSDAPVSNLD